MESQNESIYATPKADLDRDDRAPVYGGFWIRVGAALLDSIWLIALTLALGWMIYGAIYLQSTAFVMGYADFFISYVLPFVLTMLFWYYKSATPGKMLLGLRIVDAATLGKPSKGQLVGRYFAYYLSGLPLFLGFLWVAWDKRKQGWHDKLAGTLVVRRS